MSPEPVEITEQVAAAAESVGSVWPLHSFVTANPLAGFEDQPFDEAVTEAGQLLGGSGYPSVELFRQAWETGQIDPTTLREKLSGNGDDDPEQSLDRMAAGAAGKTKTKHEDEGTGSTTATATTATDQVDAVLTKWLSVFLDQGQATWPMPAREQGFYTAFHAVARHDTEIPGRSAIAAAPDGPTEAVEAILADHSVARERWETIFEWHLTALPGWTGLIKRRAADGGAWQSAAPVTLLGYLAVRLTLVDRFDAPLEPPETDDSRRDPATSPGRATQSLPAVWLDAWEATYRSELVAALTDASQDLESSSGDRPSAQLVFCIDTRSEIIRRHLEAAGSYETHGYAGFFGVPMRYDGYATAVTVDACPPILDPRHRIADRPTDDTDDAGERRTGYDRLTAARAAGTRAIKRLASNAATAYSFVESAGAGYGAALATRTLVPGRARDLLTAIERRVPDTHEFCAPALEHDTDAGGELPVGLSLEQRVEYAATAVELMGWQQFARLVVFVGHASQTANNPFDAGLDCGACAGNPGGPSARVLAAICNDEAVRSELRERGIEIPADTVFLAGEHNTTTDAVTLYDAELPETHAAEVDELRAALATARAGAAAERAGDLGADPATGVRETERRATDWAEPRPEWGLAGNASLVIGPRGLTTDLDLDGRAFLHSYDWQTDPDGDALAAIMRGPMVVTQWINTHYYFAAVDPAVHGSGSKVTQNPVGNVGVYQGNGGDLMTGLPTQSLVRADGTPQHQPLRLSAVVHAPLERVRATLAECQAVRTLLDNNWLSLTVIDPEAHRAHQYTGKKTWRPTAEAAPAPQTDATEQPASTD